MRTTIKTLVVTGLVLCCLAGSARADGWRCSKYNTSGSKAVCYISNVRFFPGENSYVKAKLHDPEEKTGCSTVTVKLNHGAGSTAGVRGAEAVLITALTTGLPIKFFKLEAESPSATDCYATSIIIAKPGH